MSDADTTVFLLLLLCLFGCGFAIGLNINTEVPSKLISDANIVCKDDEGLFSISVDSINFPVITCKNGKSTKFDTENSK